MISSALHKDGKIFSHQQKVSNGTSEAHGRPSKENYKSDVFFAFCILPPGDQDISSKGVRTAEKCELFIFLQTYIFTDLIICRFKRVKAGTANINDCKVFSFFNWIHKVFSSEVTNCVFLNVQIILQYIYKKNRS